MFTPMKQRKGLLLLALTVVGAFLVAGCSIHTSQSSNEKNKDVDIHSPFGSISVHSGDVDAKDLGLPVYPGARPSKNHDDGGDGDNANVNISSPLFGVKVVVQKYETEDPPDKVLEFYRKPMDKFGKVIQCSGGFHAGYHHHKKDAPVSCDDAGSSEKELKVGTENNQHVVAVKSQGKGSAFTLVYVRAKEADDKDTI
jgi:hypothetical protein